MFETLLSRSASLNIRRSMARLRLTVGPVTPLSIRFAEKSRSKSVVMLAKFIPPKERSSHREASNCLAVFTDFGLYLRPHSAAIHTRPGTGLIVSRGECHVVRLKARNYDSVY